MRQLFLLALVSPLLTASLSLSDLSDLSLLPRQQPGTPLYDCHAACGSVIQLSRTPEYCTTPNFTTALTSCLSCALTFDIWSSYGDSVSEAATTCNIDAVPLAANNTSSIVSSVSSLTGGMPASSASSETATGADPSATGDSADQTASLSETQTTVSETAQSAAASETADAASRPMGNKVIVGMGLLAWLFL